MRRCLLLIVVMALFLLSGCAATYKAQAEKEGQRYIGQRVHDLDQNFYGLCIRSGKVSCCPYIEKIMFGGGDDLATQMKRKAYSGTEYLCFCYNERGVVTSSFYGHDRSFFKDCPEDQ